MDKQPPKVKIHSFHYSENNYVNYGRRYTAHSLIEHSKKYPVFDLPLAGVNLSGCPWGGEMNTDNFIYHAKRVADADLSKPIILDDFGYIADGWHRICKAILEGRKTIKAVRLEDMPEPFEILNND